MVLGHDVCHPLPTTGYNAQPINTMPPIWNDCSNCTPRTVAFRRCDLRQARATGAMGESCVTKLLKELSSKQKIPTARFMRICIISHEREKSV